jgi:sugar phosphate isomerase/epimerase
MSEELRIDRRRFIGAAAGVAGAAAFGTWAPWADGRPNGPRGPIVTKGTLGIQHFSVRDAINRPPSTAPDAISGYLGGANFPEDPSDLGPLVKLPGGFQETFQYLSSVGIGGFEFYQYTQFSTSSSIPAGDARRTPTLKQLRQWLDAAGMRSFGTHTGGIALTTPNQGRLNIQIAHELGHHLIGTAQDATANQMYSSTRDAWLGAAETFNGMGAWLKTEGIKLFFHPEGTWWTFFADPDHPELDNTNKIDFFAANTDPRLVNFQIDTYHMYQNRGARPYPDGSLWDAEAFIKRNWKRLVGYHVKDASRLNPTPAPAPRAGNSPGPFTQEWNRPGFPNTLNNGADAIYSLEGDLGKGYPSDPGSTAPGARPGPDPNVIGFRRLFTEVRSTRSRGFEYHIIESDAGPGGAPDRNVAGSPNNDFGRSLRLAKISARNLLALK